MAVNRRLKNVGGGNDRRSRSRLFNEIPASVSAGLGELLVLFHKDFGFLVNEVTLQATPNRTPVNPQHWEVAISRRTAQIRASHLEPGTQNLKLLS